MTEQTNTPTPPFTAYVNGREWGSTQIVRETTTQWVSENGNRWRKKDRKLIGNTDRWFFPTLVIPGDDDYQVGEIEVIKRGAKAKARHHFDEASNWRNSYNERIKHAWSAIRALEVLRDMEVEA